MKPRIVNFQETRVAALEHRGESRPIGRSIRQFIDWRRQNNLPPSVSATYNVLYDNQIDMDICAATDRDIEPNPQGVRAKTIPGGRCAVLRHVGTESTLPETVMYLCHDWLLESGEKRSDAPLFFERVEFFPDVPSDEAVTDVYLPLKP